MALQGTRKHVVIALATRDFDPSETAVPFKRLTEAGHRVSFATADGAPGACDPIMINGGVLLGAIRPTSEHVQLYKEMAQSEAFLRPVRFADVTPEEFDMLVLPGGHAQGMRQYLEDETLQGAVGAFMARDALVGSICHGGVVLARSRVPGSDRSVVAGRRLTALPWHMEMSAWAATWPFWGNLFRTYPTSVQTELVEAGAHFERGPLVPRYGAPFVVTDGNLISARWPGDAEAFAAALVAAL